MKNAWLSLSELNGLLRCAIEAWSEEQGEVAVVAEIAEFRRGPTGHYYLKLVEKQEQAIVAQLDAVIWAGSARTVDNFRRVTGVAPATGMEVLMRGRVTFHERYGLKLEIRLLDPSYTLGEMQRLKREVIARLTQEGLIERNKGLQFPLVPQRIAVVASLDSAGFQDFLDQLGRNPYGYAFRARAYPALMQGDRAEADVGAAFARIARDAGLHDVVVLIRGGGSQVDLSCFDTYGVAKAIALCPVPVITGIGHERDETVADMVAHTRAKTPTAAAEVIIATVRRFEEHVEEAVSRLEGAARSIVTPAEVAAANAAVRLATSARRSLMEETSRIHVATTALAARTTGRLRDHLAALDSHVRRLWQSAASLSAQSAAVVEKTATLLRVHAAATLRAADAALAQLARSLSHLDPANVLARGFSITRYAGKVVRDAAETPEGAIIETTLARGCLISSVVGKELGGETRSPHLCESD